MSIRETIHKLGECVRNIAALPGEGIRQLRASGAGTAPRHARAISASRPMTAWAIAIVVAMIAAVTLVFVPQPAQADVTGTTSVDPDTTNAWQNYTNPGGVVSTQNIGRIWTDKTVKNEDYKLSGSDALNGKTISKGDFDFLVGLSAMSSTSNLKSTTTTSTPLDIVLVLDVSGSMDDSLGSSVVYNEAYDIRETSSSNEWWGWQESRGGTYYALVNGEYVQIEEELEVVHTEQGWFGSTTNYHGHVSWKLNGEVVEPKTGPNDNDSNHIQFYTRDTQTTDKIDALQNAANQFIDSVNELNQNVTDEDDLSRIAIVKYADDSYRYNIGNNRQSNGYNYTQVVSDFSSNAEDLKGDINSLNPGGATAADYGLTMAQHVLAGGQYGDRNSSGTYQGARENAQKVVIFFTDGEPNHSSGFSGSVAASSVNIAHEMKQDGTTIYTIGVLNGADPSADPTSDRTSSVNKYLHAVSSNYKDATAQDSRGEASWSNLELGDRTQNADGENANYYYAAEDSAELDQVFADITSSITENAGSGSPIVDNSQQGNTDPGDLNFSDQLGSYMQVSGDKMYLVFADGIYEGTINNNGTVTFPNHQTTANNVYGAANISSIQVTINKGTDLATGDTVNVTIPASLLPMRNYDVDTDNSTMNVTDAYPVRLFYGVSLKDGAETALNDPTNENYSDIIQSQGNTDAGTVDFYSNSFVKGSAAGSTTATFTPNNGNKFYYYTSDTPVYIDQNGTRATWGNMSSAQALYFQDNYWVNDSTGTYEVTEYVPITIGGAEYDAITYNHQTGEAYIPAHTQRTDRPATLVSQKSENTTTTAANVLVPSWSTNGQVSQALGNNGKISFPMPGQLEIKKTVDWGNASGDTKANQNSFEFTVTFADSTGAALTGTYPYAIYESGEDPIEDGTGTIGNNGKVTLKADQRVVISDLPAGTTYTVTETQANQNGFTTTDDVPAVEGSTEQNNPNDGTVTGAIVAGAQQSVSFSNNYNADEPVNLSTAATLKVQKNLQGRDWRDDDSFTFTIGAADSSTVPLPKPTTVTIDSADAQNGYAEAFGDIQYTAAGEYRYVVTETAGSTVGIDYSNAQYRVIVNVGDGGNGNLKVTSVSVDKMMTDGGTDLTQAPNSPEKVEAGADNTYTLPFMNEYKTDGTGAANIEGTKNYTDGSGTGNGIDANKFTFTIQALGGYDTATGMTGDTYPIAAADVPLPTNEDGETVTTVGNTVNAIDFPSIPFDGNDVDKTFVYQVTENKGTEVNMTYDKTVYTVYVAVTEAKDPANPDQAHIATNVTYYKPNAEGQLAQADALVFSNTYNPTDVTLGQDGAATINGTKTLTGRAMTADDTFNFKLTPQGQTINAIAAGEITGITADGLTTSVSGPADPNEAVPFNFSGITFTKTGTYLFQLDETDSGVANGITYDEHTCVVTVTVGLDKAAGKLTADVSYDNSGNAFTNNYHASMNYGAEGEGGINVTKTLLDRLQFAGEFSFSIEGQGDAADLVTDADKSFTNEAAAAGATSTMEKLQNLTFDETDTGKTYTFTVKENVPAEGDRLPQVAYDQSEYQVAIQVVDNGNGTMHTLTTVTKTKDANGDAIDPAEVVINAANSDDDNYEIPTFGFTNDYNPDPAEVGEGAAKQIQVTKTVTGAPSPNGVKYSFTLTAKDTVDGKVANIEGLSDGKLTEYTTGTINADGEDGTKDDSQTLTFDTLKFTAPGTYTFEVTEDTMDTDNGWTFDTTSKIITVTVSAQNPAYTQDGDKPLYDGNLYVTSVTGSPAEVTNSYHADSVTVGEGTDDKLQLSKTVTGYGTDADFHFTLTPVEEEGVDWSGVTYADGAKTTAITDHFNAGDTKYAEFGKITFTEKGIYKFDVTEDEGTDETPEDPGWTYDDQTDQLTVTVTDNDHDGFLEAKVSGMAAFTNSYDPNPATLTGSTDFKGTKTLDGRGALEGETFGFKLTKGSVSGGGDWSKVTFTPTGDTAATFDKATATATMNNAASASFWFDGQFAFDQAGTYVFNVNETQHNGKALPQDGTNGMTYDRHTGTITVTVTEDGSGTLKATAVAGTDGASTTFTNHYDPTPATYGGDGVLFGGTKTVEDSTGNSFVMADNQFTFMLRAQAQGNPMPEGYDGTTVDADGRPVMSVKNENTNTTNNTATYDFGTITFDKDDMAGAQPVEGQNGQFSKTFQYNVYELETGTGAMPAGVSAKDSGRTYTVTFTVVEDQNKGTITVSNVDVKLHNGADSVEMGKLDFTNVYKSNETTGATTLFKTLDGRNWQKGDTFTFDVSMKANGLNGGAALTADQLPDFNFNSVNGTVNDYTESDGQLSYNITINPESVTGNTFQFNTGTATYKHEGTYVYTITERNVDAVPSVAKDDQVYTVTVTVEDQNGTLNREVEISPATTSGRVDFTNTYTTTGKLDSKGDEAIKVTKDFTGRVNDEWLDTDVFKAMLTAEDSTVDGQTMAAEDVPMPDGRTGGVATVDLTKDNHENVAFGDITYTRPGTYNYTLTEVQENSLEGVYYSYAEYDVVVTAEDNGDGTMTVTSEITQTKDNDGVPLAPTKAVDVATFDNVYQPNFATLDGKQNLTVTKNLVGRGWFGTDEWTFTLALTDGDASKVIMPAQTQLTVNANTPDFKASFGNITFRAAGTYTFTVTESGVEPGVTNDADAERTIVVNVTDDTKGNLVAEVDSEKSGDLTFTNTYESESVTLTGEDAIKVQKTLDNRAWADGEAYSFTIAPAEGYEDVPMPENDTITVSRPDDGATNTAQFGDMTFTQAGTYVYEITENVPTGDDADASMTYDKHVATVRIVVAENQSEGKLKIAEVHYDNSEAPNEDDKYVTDAAAFTNAQTLETTLKLTGAKMLEGRDFAKGDSFTFNVTADDNAPMPNGVDENGNVTINPTEDTYAVIDFGTITFDDAGEYVYHITEQAGDVSGMTYDTTTRDVIVSVTNDGQGNLTAKVTPETAANLNWTNAWTFVPGDAVSLNGTKTMTGREMTEGQFTFTVEPQNDAPMGESLSAAFNGAVTASEDGDSWTAPIELLKNISYDAPGEYVYLISEVNDGQPGITYDTTQYKVTVTVAQDGAPTTKIEKSTNGKDWTEADAVAFSNSYATEGSATLDGSANLNGTKTLTGRDWSDTDSFTFVLAAGNEPTKQAVVDGTVHMPDTLAVVQGVYTDGAAVPFNFGNIVFDKAGTYTFTIAEQQPGDDGFVGPTAGMTYDGHERTITVTVADDGNGKLEATAEATGDPNWENTYKAGGDDEPGILSGAENLEVTKVIDGRDWQDGDSFTFVLTADEKNPEGAKLPENASELKITNGTADHKAAFGDITFTQPGNYTFYVNEQVPADENKLGGMTYDDAQRVIEVNVVDNGDGKLVPTATVTSEKSLTFTNVYGTGEKTATLDGATNLAVTKELKGRGWQDGDSFTFTLTANDGTTASAVKRGAVTLPENADNLTITDETTGHKAAFGDITFSETGEYSFKITEIKGDAAHMTYDGHTRVVTVKVTDNKQGELVAKIVKDKTTGSATFTNVYYDETSAKDVATDTDDAKTSVDGKMVGVGDTLTYTIDWASNALDESGNPVASTITVSDAIPSGTSLVKDSISEGGELSEDGRTITWTLEDQAYGTTGTVSFQVTVDETAVNYDAVTNKATVTVGNNNPYTTNEVSTTVPEKSETTNPDKIGEGTVLTYQIQFTNKDGDNATAEVVDTLTKGQAYNAGSATVNGRAVEPTIDGDAANGQTLTWNLTDLGANEQVTITFDVTITRDAGASVDNTAKVNGHSTNTTTTPYPSDDKKDVFEASDPTTSVNGKLVGVGDELVYEIDWAADTDGKVTVTDTIPTGTKLVEGSIDNGGTYDETANTITWNLGDKKKGDKGTVSFHVTVTDDAVENDPVTNTAEIAVGNNKPTTVTATIDIPSKTVTDETPDTGIQVGDTLDYTIEWANHEDSEQTVTIVDTLPDGLTYIDGSANPSDGFTAEGQKLNWTFQAQPNTEGTVTFNAKVNENATTVENPVTNQATVTVGDNSYKTNTTGDEPGDKVKKGKLIISKTVTVDEAQGTTVDTDKAFAFTVTLKGTDDQPLTGTYKYSIGDGEEQDLDLNDQGQATVELKHDQTATIKGLPEGASYTVTEADYTADGYTTETPDNATGDIVSGKDGTTVAFTNAYKATGTEIGGEGEDAVKGITVRKTFTGRETGWSDADAFRFMLAAVDDAPMPQGEGSDVITIGKPAEGDVNTNVFGSISYDKVGTYKYTVTETQPTDDNAELDGNQLAGVTYDAHTANVTVTVSDDDHDGRLEAAVSYDNADATTDADKVVTDAAAFTNTYGTTGTTDTPDPGTGDGHEGSITLRKVLTGKAWNGDKFTFKIAPADDESKDYVPDPAEVTVDKATGTNESGDDYADFGWIITYDKAGTYTYTVTEVAGDNPAMDYDTHKATVTVKVTDNGKGGYTASATVENGTFTNEYANSLEFGAEGEGGLWIKKTLTNHDIADGQFEFTVTAADQASADKAGFDGMTKVVKSTAATMGDDGTATSMAEIFSDATFTQDDADDTYTYTVEETKGGDAGYTNDGTVYTVTITTADDGNGRITVTTTVTDGADYSKSYVYDNDEATDDPQAFVPFSNGYESTGTLGGDGEGAVTIKATKSLTNRPLVDGEFTFNVIDANGTTVATGTNGADGNVTFTPIDYTKAGLLADAENGAATYSQVDGKDTFAYQYTVAEAESNFVDGVTPIADSFTITVTVTDNNDGTLGVAVAYPDGGDGLEFRNAYGAGETGQTTLNVNGTKKLTVESGDNAPDITGKFTFTLKGSEGAPMPERTEATNDAAGNVNFGDITYTMENVFGDTGDAAETRSAERTKTFTYTVAESGKVAGVTNDAETSKTFEVTVTDNGDGTLSVTSAPTGAEFAFTNTYSVEPTDPTEPTDPNPDDTDKDHPNGKAWVAIDKTIDGRDLKDGEFEFKMTGRTGTNSEGMATTGTNDADGNVTLGDGVVFTAPGDYVFDIVEVQPENQDTAGVTYDGHGYTATATVTDNGDGTLKVAWKVSDGAKDVDTITFANHYKATSTSVSLSATKALKDGELKDGQFGFELKDDGDGKDAPMPEGAKDGVYTAKNAADGTIDLGSITFEKAGTYRYTVSEVNDGQDLVTYDDTVYEITVKVTDDLKGRLSAEVSIAANGEPVDGMAFTNIQEKAAAKPEEPKPTIPQTGSPIATPLATALVLMIGAAGAFAVRERSRRNS